MNIDSLWKNEHQQKKLLKEKFSSIRRQYGFHASRIPKIVALDHGFCGELCDFIGQLFSSAKIQSLTQYCLLDIGIAVDRNKNHHFMIFTEKHKCVRHLHFSSFEHLCQKFSDQEAILVDPWIYAASPILEWREHLAQAKSFNVEDYYTDAKDGWIQKTYDFTTPNYISENIVQEFRHNFQELVARLTSKAESPYRRRFSSAELSVDNWAHKRLERTENWNYSWECYYLRCDKKLTRKLYGKNQRHHCRFCGQSFCNEHSQWAYDKYLTWVCS